MTQKSKQLSWGEIFQKEFLSTCQLYVEIYKHPVLLFLGTYYVARDIFYELPKSLFCKKIYKNLETQLDENASQALTLSEIVTIPGNYIGLFVAKSLTTNMYLASIIGANVGDYIFWVGSYAIAYMILTRGHWSAYTPRKALIDNVVVIKDCLPAAITLYVTEAPLIAFFLFLGFSADVAVGINLVIAIIIFIGVAKYSATKNIEKRFL